MKKKFEREIRRTFQKDELMIILTNLREKQGDWKQINREVFMLLDEEEFENDIRQTIHKI